MQLDVSSSHSSHSESAGEVCSMICATSMALTADSLITQTPEPAQLLRPGAFDLYLPEHLFSLFRPPRTLG